YRDAVAAARGGLAIAEHVPRKPHARSELNRGNVEEVGVVILDAGPRILAVGRSVERPLPDVGEGRTRLWVDGDLVGRRAGGGGYRGGAGRVEHRAGLAGIVRGRGEQGRVVARRVQVAHTVEAHAVVERQPAAGLPRVLHVPRSEEH